MRRPPRPGVPLWRAPAAAYHPAPSAVSAGGRRECAGRAALCAARQAGPQRHAGAAVGWCDPGHLEGVPVHGMAVVMSAGAAGAQGVGPPGTDACRATAAATSAPLHNGGQAASDGWAPSCSRPPAGGGAADGPQADLAIDRGFHTCVRGECFPHRTSQGQMHTHRWQLWRAAHPESLVPTKREWQRAATLREAQRRSKRRTNGSTNNNQACACHSGAFTIQPQHSQLTKASHALANPLASSAAPLPLGPRRPEHHPVPLTSHMGLVAPSPAGVPGPWFRRISLSPKSHTWRWEGEGGAGPRGGKMLCRGERTSAEGQEGTQLAGCWPGNRGGVMLRAACSS